MTLGVVFDRLSACYRARPLLFAGIVLPTAVVGLLFDILFLSLRPESLDLAGGDLKTILTPLLSLIPLFAVTFLMMVVLSALTQGATVAAVVSLERGDEVTLRRAWGAATARGWTLGALGLTLAGLGLFYLMVTAGIAVAGGVVLAQLHPVAGVVTSLFLGSIGLLGGLPLVAILGIAVPVAAELPPGAVSVAGAIRRSVDLTRGRRLIVLLVYLLTGVAAGVVTFLFQFPFLLAGSVLDPAGPGLVLMDAGSMTSSAVAHLIAAPIPLVAVAVLYRGLQDAGKSGSRNV